MAHGAEVPPISTHPARLLRGPQQSSMLPLLRRRGYGRPNVGVCVRGPSEHCCGPQPSLAAVTVLHK
eukprot:7859865-Alexandrium_andersonii.AAC.1